MSPTRLFEEAGAASPSSYGAHCKIDGNPAQVRRDTAVRLVVKPRRNGFILLGHGTDAPGESQRLASRGSGKSAASTRTAREFKSDPTPSDATDRTAACPGQGVADNQLGQATIGWRRPQGGWRAEAQMRVLNPGTVNRLYWRKPLIMDPSRPPLPLRSVWTPQPWLPHHRYPCQAAGMMTAIFPRSCCRQRAPQPRPR